MPEDTKKDQAMGLNIDPKDLLGKLDKSIGDVIDPYVQKLINMPYRNIIIAGAVYYLLTKDKRPAVSNK